MASARADTSVSEPPPQPSLSSATAVPRAEAGSSGYVSSGPIPFDPQPTHVHIPFESSSSAAMLQSPPPVSNAVSVTQGQLSQRAGDISQPSKDLREGSAELLASPKQKRLHDTFIDSTTAHQHEPEHDDGPMEEILLHTDTESASNEAPEEPRHYLNTARQTSYPINAEAQPPEPAESNGAPNQEESTQAGSAAVAEAIAAANRAAEESSGGRRHFKPPPPPPPPQNRLHTHCCTALAQGSIAGGASLRHTPRLLLSCPAICSLSLEYSPVVVCTSDAHE